MSEGHSTVQYRDIPGFLGYRVGDDGSVWSLWYRGCQGVMGTIWRLLKQTRCKMGRLWVRLAGGGRSRNRLVHQLVLEVFVGPRPKGLECRHLDGDSTNNAPTNLKWGTHKENMEDMVRHGRHYPGFRWWKNPAKYSAKVQAAVRNRHAGGESANSLAKSLGMDKATVRDIVQKRNGYRD
jgi:hypothetical protein